MKKLLVLGFAILLLAGCTSIPNTPFDVSKAYMESIDKGDYKLHKKVIDWEGGNFHLYNNDKGKMVLKHFQTKFKEKYGGIIETIKISEEEKGDILLVVLLLKYMNSAEERFYFEMIQRDGKWLVHEVNSEKDNK